MSREAQSEMVSSLSGIKAAIEREQPAVPAPPPAAELELQAYKLNMAKLKQLGQIAKLRKEGVSEEDIAAALK
jgi:hypothetical protein